MIDKIYDFLILALAILIGTGIGNLLFWIPHYIVLMREIKKREAEIERMIQENEPK